MKEYRMTIGGAEWKLIVEDQRIELDNSGVFGYCDLDNREIHVSTENIQSQEEFNRVLLHEVTHAILGMSGINQVFSKDVEEGIAMAMEGLGSQILSVVGVRMPPKNKKKKKGKK